MVDGGSCENPTPTERKNPVAGLVQSGEPLPKYPTTNIYDNFSLSEYLGHPQPHTSLPNDGVIAN